MQKAILAFLIASAFGCNGKGPALQVGDAAPPASAAEGGNSPGLVDLASPAWPTAMGTAGIGLSTATVQRAPEG